MVRIMLTTTLAHSWGTEKRLMYEDPLIGKRELTGRDFTERILEQWAAALPKADFKIIRVTLRLSRAALYYDGAWAKLAAANRITIGESSILSALRRAGPPFSMRPSELAKSLWVTPSGITRQVERLVARGLVEKTEQPSDRRCVVITLTAAGRRLAEAQMVGLIERIEQRALLEFTDLELKEFERLLCKLMTRLEATVPPPVAGIGDE